MTFLFLFLLEASPAVNQYLTGKVPEEQGQLLLEDVFICNEQIMLSVTENFRFVYHCLLRRIVYCDRRRHKLLQSGILSQNKSRTHCNSIVQQGVATSHQHQTLNIQILHNFIIHIDILLFDWEWYSQVYHGLSVSEYIRDGGRDTTYYTWRRLPWAMVTTSNTAVMTISTFAHLKFRPAIFYSSTKWYSNV